jgi:hypothetical protein
MCVALRITGVFTLFIFRYFKGSNFRKLGLKVETDFISEMLFFFRTKTRLKTPEIPKLFTPYQTHKRLQLEACMYIA